MISTNMPTKRLVPLSKAACVGGGVIGGGWIARFLLAGVDVKVHDPHPEAQRIVGEVIANAEQAYRLLTSAPLPRARSFDFLRTPCRRSGGCGMGAGERAGTSRSQVSRAR